MAWRSAQGAELKDATLPLIERFTAGELGLGEHRLAARLEPADSLPQDDARYGLLRAW